MQLFGDSPENHLPPILHPALSPEHFWENIKFYTAIADNSIIIIALFYA